MLYRRKNSSRWWCRFTTPDGREIRQSTGTSDRKDAEGYEAKLKRDLWQQSKLGEKPRKSWQEAVVRWIDETSHKASHGDDLMHLRWLDTHLGDVMLDEIDIDRVDEVIKGRKGSGVSNATVNRTLAVLRAILRRAERKWRWIDRAPAISLLPEPKQRIRWLTHEEADRLIDELPEHLADMARFTLATGLRASNVTGLEWSQVDLARRVAWIHADQAKARRAIGVSLNSDAVQVLRRWIGRHATRVFCYQRRVKGGGVRWEPIAEANSAAWYKALKRAGIADFRWHDLRHTWASWHVQAGTPLHALQEMGGWSSFEMVRRYAHLAPEHLAEYAARIESRDQGAHFPSHIKVVDGGMQC
ncbi:tyrosine-type recombinase/integrase [Marichromatium gracile]|uniref:Site-specific recombinase XerD n=1 Tax=Marichromatium gracile TaxID=1048 RepID=A0A4R4A5B2_MARGR|nr:site-specific integrase [Marichromatium gracile]MBK1709836.1 integrase [Marichromatium gracile]TCW32650.1 site-specific recombinase XerD [Marichromatium gracile]